MGSKGASPGGESLEDLIKRVEACAPEDRINHRDSILAFGSACIRPLGELADRIPQLSPSIAAWLEVLARRDPATKADVVKALAVMARERDGNIAGDVLDRLGGAPRTVGAKTARKRTPTGRTAEADVHARIIRAAREGRILTYSDLETSRGHVGKYLFNISRLEADLGHPPLTSLVVSKTNGLPGDGFLPAMEEIGFAHPGEKLEPVWRRAVAEVHAFWAKELNG